MGSGGGGGGGGSSYDDAPMKAKAKSSRQKAEEQALGKESYAQSSSGNIVRSSSGSGVTSSKGAKARDDYRENLFQKSDLSTYSPFGDVVASERGKDVARMQLEYRQLKDPIANLGKALPFGIGTGLMGIGSMNRKQQLANLVNRGQPQFKYTESGRFVVGGVSSPDSGGNRGDNVINSFSSGSSEGGDNGSPSSTSTTSKTTATSTPSKQASTAARRLLNQSAEKSAKRRNLLNRPSV